MTAQTSAEYRDDEGEPDEQPDAEQENSDQRERPGDGDSGNDDAPNPDSTKSTTATDSTTVPHTTTYTPRFAGFVALLGVLTAAGIVTFQPAAIAAGTILLAFIAIGILHTPTPPANALTTTYELSTDHPRPAAPVTVTITVTNESQHTFTDLRLVDTVPDTLNVIEGTPRAAATLRAGDSMTVEYTVTARRGTHSFGPVTARTRAVMGSLWVQQPLPGADDARIRCAVQAEDIPLEEQATHFIGELLSSNGGDGLEFYATREYHRGDSPTRINWRELAKRGELSTVTYREQQSADITVIPDARTSSRVNSGGGPSAATLSMYAAYQITSTLTQAGHYIGLAIPGLQPREARQNTSTFPYRRIDHGQQQNQHHTVFKLLNELETDLDQSEYKPTETSPTRPLGSGSFRSTATGDTVFDVEPYQVNVESFMSDLEAWCSNRSQFIFITPLRDAGAQALCQQLHSRGYPLVVIAPDVTTPAPAHDHPTDALPERIRSVQRSTRIETLRKQGITVIDWNPAVPLSVCCEQQTLPGR